MVVFLTSSFVEYQPREKYVPKPLNEANGFGENLRKYWKENAHFLIFASDFSDEEMSNHLIKEMSDAFSMAGFSIGEIRCFDNRFIERYRDKNKGNFENVTKDALKEALEWADVFFLAGGHAPTENYFMKQCDLKSLINDREIFDGIFIGLSAGAINAADEVYLVPEFQGESIDSKFVRFTDGLGLTSINIVPHSEHFKDVILDGKKFIEEIVAEDSIDREVYIIPDGSYFIIRNGITEFFGEGMVMQNGVTRPIYSGIIHSDNSKIRKECTNRIIESVKIFNSIVSEYYDWVLIFDSESGQVEFLHISNLMLENGIIPVNIDTFDELNQIFATNLVTKEEKETVIDQTKISVICNDIKHKGSYVRTIHIEVGDGIRAENLRVSRIEGDDKRFLVCLTDISMILDHDWMTDEYSRDGFIAKAEMLLKEPQYHNGYSIVYTNIKGFKAINDLLGTFSGDMVIFKERDILVRELEPVLMARFESDHFALITKTENLSEEKMDKICHFNYIEGSKCLPILMRCGIYNIVDPTRKIHHMIDRAKLAENSISSDRGADYAVCDEKMSSEYVSQRLLISELDNALQKGEFQPYYQPVVDAKTGEIVGAEALIRWKHPEKGMISPGQFIPIFEKEGHITKIDSFMANRIFDFNLNRVKNGKKAIPCAINLSRVDFYDTKFMNMMKQKLGDQENVKNILKLEVTESSYTLLETEAVSFLEQVKKLGISLMLDDFGSGVSSLSTIENFEFDIIKLDMGFVAQIGKSAKGEAIIKHVIGLFHDLGAKVVAEGVETKEQLEFLLSVDCDMIQGYYFYKPMPEEEFVKLL